MEPKRFIKLTGMLVRVRGGRIEVSDNNGLTWRDRGPWEMRFNDETKTSFETPDADRILKQVLEYE